MQSRARTRTTETTAIELDDAGPSVVGSTMKARRQHLLGVRGGNKMLNDARFSRGRTGVVHRHRACGVPRDRSATSVERNCPRDVVLTVHAVGFVGDKQSGVRVAECARFMTQSDPDPVHGCY